MPVTAEQMRVLRDSLPLVEAAMVPMSLRFYDNLFALAPEMRSLFREDLGGQGMKFVSTLATVVALLDRRAALGDAGARLARAHARVGVRPEHFGALGCALMVTMGETLGSDFTEERQAAWRAAYDAVAAAMAAEMTPAPSETAHQES